VGSGPNGAEILNRHRYQTIFLNDAFLKILFLRYFFKETFFLEDISWQ